MDPRARTALLAVSNIVLGLACAWLLRDWTLPLRSSEGGSTLGGWSVLFLPVTVAAGASIGLLQGYIASLEALWLAIAVGLVASVPVFYVIATMTQLSRIFPVPGGGPGIDPSAAELNGGLLYWTAFVVGMTLVVLAFPLVRSRAETSSVVE